MLLCFVMASFHVCSCYLILMVLPAFSGQASAACTSPQSVPNSRVEILAINSSITIAKYTCDDAAGYVGRGKNTVACLEIHGYSFPWSPLNFTCERVRCLQKITEMVPNSVNDYVTLRSDHSYNDSRCVIYYHPYHSSSCRQYGYGRYSYYLTSKYTHHSNFNIYYNSFVNFTCDQGYSLRNGSNSVLVYCGIDGQWIQPENYCIARCDQQPPVVQHSKYEVRGKMLGEVTTYTCDEGYVAAQNASDFNITCQSDRTWSTVQACERKDCGQPPILANGRLEREVLDTRYGASVIYRCLDLGYNLHGQREVFCQSNATWGQLPVCQRVNCGNPPPVAHSRRLHGSGHYYNDQITYLCERGHSLKGNTTICCQFDGFWTAPPTCEKGKCGTPPMIGSTRYVSDISGDHFVGDELTYQCLHGFKANGPTVVSCLSSMEWTEPETCERTNCGEPFTVANTKRRVSGHYYNDSTTYECKLGFSLTGGSVSLCQADGHWSVPPSCHVVSCGVPPTINHGLVSEMEGFSLGEKIIYQCMTGYRLVGVDFVICHVDGTWSLPPLCHPFYCPDPPPVPHTTSHITGKSAGDVAMYQCELGYKLVGDPITTCQTSGLWTSAPSCDGATPKVSYPRKCAVISGCGENLSKSAYYRHINKNCCKPDQENIENDAIRNEADATARLLDLRRIFLAGFMFAQKASGMSNRSIVLVVKFVVLFINLLAEVLVLDELKAFTRLIPETYQTMCSYLRIDGNDFQQFAVCDTCDSIYMKDQVVNGTICRCNFVRWPNHPHRTQRVACNTELHIGNGKTPKGVFCLRPVTSYMRDFVLQNDFIERCNAWRTRTIRDGYMADIYDGRLWVEQRNDYLASPYNLYGLINIDWFSPYKHTPWSVGAVYIIILNLPRAERYKESNVLCVAILPGPREPKLTANTYLKPLVDDLQLLDRGIELTDATMQGAHTYRFRILGCASDLPATRKLGGFLSFHATSGCSKCLKQFPRIANESGISSKADYSGYERAEWRPRDGNDHKRCAEIAKSAASIAERQRLESAGVRWTELFRLNYFDPIIHHTIDPMHCLFLGIAKTMTKHYLTSGLIDADGLQGLQSAIDMVRVPHTIGRIPNKILSGFSSFTADQWKNWTLIYSSSVLRPVLPASHYQLWMKFVHAVSLITRKIIRLTDLTLADSLMVSFCSDVEKVYGNDFMKPNFHMACHMKDVVSDYGPPFAFWCFSFERYNGILGNYTTNNHEISPQMMSKFLIGKELCQMKWPLITPKPILDLLLESDSRGTVSTVGHDIVSHANKALAECLFTTSFTIDLLDSSLIQLGRRQTSYYIDGDCFQRQIQELYSHIFPADSRPILHRNFERVDSVIYEGEIFQPHRQDTVNCNIIRARWLRADYSRQIDASEKFPRAGSIHSILVTHHTSPDGRKESMVLLQVDWFSMHDSPYALGNNNQIYHKTIMQPGMHSFVPIQRVISKCALRVCKYQNIDVYLIIPLLGKWAM